MKSYVKDYPRPQLVRGHWENLNGTWDFAFDDRNAGETEKWFAQFPKAMEIKVPFTYEATASGIGDTSEHRHVWYSRSIIVTDCVENDKRLLLHFEGCDYHTQVWVNGQKAGSHRGGYARFSFDITALVKPGENNITVKADDSFDEAQPRGKQRWVPENFGCWYIQNTGIWKTVWLEYVPQASISALKLTPDVCKGEIVIEAILNAESLDGLSLEAEASFEGVLKNRVAVSVLNRRVTIRMQLNTVQIDMAHSNIHFWSPESPALYDLRLTLAGSGAQDTVLSYFGMREIRIDGSNILLNGAPLYQRLILDQGYWDETLLTPPSEEALIEDIEKVMQLGYNGVRKHQKTEDERFLYWADVKGLLVWSEVPAAYAFHDDAVEWFTQEWMEIVRQNYSHPAIITWTPFNESWGLTGVKTERKPQSFTEAIYHLTKSFDSMRPVIVNDGWEHTISDIITLHDYEASGARFFARYSDRAEEILSGEISHSSHMFAFADGYEYDGQPVLISEYGGIAFNNDDNGWGYGDKVQTEEDFLRRFEEITMAIKNLPYVCGFCYTQVSDVQQEINGLMDIQRNFKIASEKISEINLRKTDGELGFYDR